MPRLIVALLLVAGCSPASRPYHRAYQKALLVGIATMAACDVSQTLNVSNNGAWDGVMSETNPVLGKRPSTFRIVGTATAGLVLLGAFTLIPHEYLPEEIKSVLMSYVAIGEGATVYYNARAVDRGLTWCGRGPVLGKLPSESARH